MISLFFLLHCVVMGKAEGSVAQETWHGHVTALSVAPEYRRLGLAAIMMNILEEISERLVVKQSLQEIHITFFGFKPYPREYYLSHTTCNLVYFHERLHGPLNLQDGEEEAEEEEDQIIFLDFKHYRIIRFGTYLKREHECMTYNLIHLLL